MFVNQLVFSYLYRHPRNNGLAAKNGEIQTLKEFGEVYVFEVDGFGTQSLMDDANVPSLPAMAYLGDVDKNDPIYQNTRRYVWSDHNPYIPDNPEYTACFYL